MLISNSSHLKTTFESPSVGIKSPCRLFPWKRRRGIGRVFLYRLPAAGDVEKSEIKNG